MNLSDLRVKLFADGADLNHIRHMATIPYIKGFTTNPTLMRKAGVDDYEAWAKQVLEAVPDKPVSFEVLSDDFGEMERQARKIASWGENVYVKIPITNTRRESSIPLIGVLSQEGVKVNVTAIFTQDQLCAAGAVLRGGAPSILSVFAGRIADAGADPTEFPMYLTSLYFQMLWASTRELFNIIQAERCGYDIITVPDKLLHKLDTLGKSLDEFSRETVQQFRDDAVAAGYTL